MSTREALLEELELARKDYSKMFLEARLGQRSAQRQLMRMCELLDSCYEYVKSETLQ